MDSHNQPRPSNETPTITAAPSLPGQKRKEPFLSIFAAAASPPEDPLAKKAKAGKTSAPAGESAKSDDAAASSSSEHKRIEPLPISAAATRDAKAPAVEAKEDKRINPSEILSNETKRSIAKRIQAVFRAFKPGMQADFIKLYGDRYKKYPILPSSDGTWGYQFEDRDEAVRDSRFLVFADGNLKSSRPKISALSNLFQPQIVSEIVADKTIHWLQFKLADKNEDNFNSTTSAEAYFALETLGTMWVDMPSSMPNINNVEDRAATLQHQADTLLKGLNKESKHELQLLLRMLLSWAWGEFNGQLGCKFHHRNIRDNTFKHFQEQLRKIKSPILTDMLMIQKFLRKKGDPKKLAIDGWLQVGSDSKDKTPTSKSPKDILFFLNCLINGIGKKHHIERPAVEWPTCINLFPSKKKATAAAASAPAAPSKKKGAAAAAAPSRKKAVSENKASPAAATSWLSIFSTPTAAPAVAPISTLVATAVAEVEKDRRPPDQATSRPAATTTAQLSIFNLPTATDRPSLPLEIRAGIVNHGYKPGGI